jgi:hypothetical protein
MKNEKENYTMIEQENNDRPIIIVNNDLGNKFSPVIGKMENLKSINKLKEEF